MKKVFTLLVLMLLLVNVQAQQFDQGVLSFEITAENTATVIGIHSYATDIDIPSSVMYNSKTYPVTRIGDKAFENQRRLYSIEIPNSVTSIGEGAFSECMRLSGITIPNSVTVIGKNAFFSCYNLTSVTIGNSVTSIGDDVFFGCSGLTSITIPNSVISIGKGAFNNCYRLTSVTIGDSVTVIGNSAFYYCLNLTSVTIGNSVTSIGNYAFYGCSGLTSVTIGDSVTSIGNYAFYGCSGLTSITIPNSVTVIGEQTFNDCRKLTKFIVSEQNTKYSTIDGVLSDKDKTTLIAYPNAKSNVYIIPNNVTSIGDYAFYRCSDLTNVTIPNGVISIGNSAFSVCPKLEQLVVYEENIKYSTVDGVLFNKDKTTLIAYPNAKANIYIIPNNVISIEDYAFYRCSDLTNVTIPNSVTSIGKEAFYDCSGLTSVTISNSATSIEGEALGYYIDLGEAFSHCLKLMEIHCLNSIPVSIYNFGYKIPSQCTLYVPKGSLNAYREASGWGRFKYIIEEDPSSINENEENAVKVYTEAGVIIVQNAEIGETIAVYSQSGILIKTIKATDDINRIELSDKGIYIIRIANQSVKVILH